MQNIHVQEYCIQACYNRKSQFRYLFFLPHFLTEINLISRKSMTLTLQYIHKKTLESCYEPYLKKKESWSFITCLWIILSVEKAVARNNDKNDTARGKKRVQVASATTISLLCLMVIAGLPSSYGPSTVDPMAKIINYPAKNISSVATKQQAQKQQYWQNFLNLEREAWHYNYVMMENQNILLYQKWYCADLRAHGYKDLSYLCDRSAYPRDEMWRYEQFRDEILWNKANHQPHHEIKETSEQLQYLQKRAEVRLTIAQNESANNTSWRHYLSLQGEAWHYDYALTEKQNLREFQKWWLGGATSEMWFSEQYRGEILWEKAAATGVGKVNNNDDQQPHLQKHQQHWDNSAVRSTMQLWFEVAYYRHNAEIAKNNCVNPWDRTPANASPSWLACIEAHGRSVS